jgi:hypothetical protein
MKFILSLLALAGLSHAVELDVEAVGRDFNGWSAGLARYARAGADFEVSRPTTATDADGRLVVTTVIREKKRGSAVFEGTLEATVSPDGLVRTLAIAGNVDGREFESGTVTRPEPLSPAEPAATPESDAPAAPVAEVPPVDPMKEMRQGLGEGLRSGIERARSSERVVKRDLSAWIFTPSASSAEALAEGVDAVVRAIFRHSRRS